METWKDIPGLEGMYQASTEGRIRSLRVLKPHKVAGNGYHAVRLPESDPSKSRKQRTHYIHALVAAAFLGPRPPRMHVNHKDETRTNNWPENLEYLTPLDNVRYSYRNKHKLTASQMDTIADLYFNEGRSALGLAKELGLSIKVIHSVIHIWRADRGKNKRRNPYQHKLTMEKAREIRKMYRDTTLSQTAIAKLYNVDAAHISRVVSGQLWPEREGHHDAEIAKLVQIKAAM